MFEFDKDAVETAKRAQRTRSSERFLRLLSKPTPQNDLEAIIDAPATAAPPVPLGERQAKATLEAFEERVTARLTDAPYVSEKADAHIKAIVNNAKTGMGKLVTEGPEAALNPDEDIAMEVIVETDGSRPALEFVDGALVTEGEDLGDYAFLINTHKARIEEAARSVGRINLEGVHYGTGFSLGDGRILTNRHVLQEIATESAPGAWTFNGAVSIDFGGGQQLAPDLTFDLRSDGIVTGDQAIDPHRIAFSKLDYAMLRCAVSDGQDFPAPFARETKESMIVPQRPVYVLGFPGRPHPGQYDAEVLMLLFDYQFGVKRFSPGEIEQDLSLPNSEDRTVFSYDATTLGGNSGSPVLDVGGQGTRLVGVHFAGLPGRENYAHSVAAPVFREDLVAKGVFAGDTVTG